MFCAGLVLLPSVYSHQIRGSLRSVLLYRPASCLPWECPARKWRKQQWGRVELESTWDLEGKEEGEEEEGPPLLKRRAAQTDNEQKSCLKRAKPKLAASIKCDDTMSHDSPVPHLHQSPQRSGLNNIIQISYFLYFNPYHCNNVKSVWQHCCSLIYRH